MALYKIKCYSQDHQQIDLQYDNMTGMLYDNDNNPLFEQHRFPTRQFKTNKVGSVEFDGLRLMIGTKCNFHCKYCAEGTSTDRVNSSATYLGSMKDVDYFIDHADEWMQHPPKFIDFRGGEPGVYYKLLHRLIPQCREKWPECAFGMLSNGSLINDSFAQMLLDYQCALTISHDGPGQSERGEDPLLDPSKVGVLEWLFDQYQLIENPSYKKYWASFKFHATMNKKSLNPIAVVQYFRQHFHRPAKVNFYVVGGVGNGQYYTIPDDDMMNILVPNIIRSCILTDDAPGNFKRFIRDFYDYGQCSNKGQAFGSFCSARDVGALIVGLNGRVIRCQNFAHDPYSMGWVYDQNNIQDDAFVDYRTRECCQNCPVIGLCKGTCGLFESGNYFSETCRTKYYYCLGLMIAAIIQMTGLLPYRIEGRVIRPKKELIETSHGSYDHLDFVNIPYYLN